jgi:hypothetical protein
MSFAQYEYAGIVQYNACRRWIEDGVSPLYCLAVASSIAIALKLLFRILSLPSTNDKLSHEALRMIASTPFALGEGICA